MGLNKVIEDRIGLGSYHVRVFFVLCLIDMNDGV